VLWFRGSFRGTTEGIGSETITNRRYHCHVLAPAKGTLEVFGSIPLEPFACEKPVIEAESHIVHDVGQQDSVCHASESHLVAAFEAYFAVNFREMPPCPDHTRVAALDHFGQKVK